MNLSVYGNRKFQANQAFLLANDLAAQFPTHDKMGVPKQIILSQKTKGKNKVV